MFVVPKIKLNNGSCIPLIGLGTWRSTPDVITQAIKDAIDVGYRHFDCAHIYENEREIGLAIADKLKAGAIKREDIFVTSKLWNTFHRPESVLGACETTLNNLQLSYLDCYLIHWPTAYKEGAELIPQDENGKVIWSDHDYVDTWHAMEKLIDAGLCRSIGVSNFNKRQIERIVAHARIPPAILQVECHPYLNQKRLIDFCCTQKIAVTAYSPLGSAQSPYKKPGEFKLMEHPTILSIAKSNEKNPAQILLRYQMQRGVIVIPRSINKAHMESNLRICSFKLSASDMSAIDGLDINGRYMTWSRVSGHPHHPFENDEY